MMQPCVPCLLKRIALCFLINEIQNVCVDALTPTPRKVNILRELRHPFIVRYYDRIVDRRRTRLHIVMEHCSTDLARVIKTSRLRG